MKSFFKLLRIEGKLSLRCPDGIIFGLGMPVGILLLIAIVGGDVVVSDGSYTFFESAFASLLTVGICATGCMGLPIAIADYREKKILKHYFVTPIRPITILFVQVCICMIISIASAVLIGIIAVLFFGYQMKGNLIALIGTYFLVMSSIYAIGLIVASVCHSVKTVNVVTTFVYFPMVFLSGATIPFELFPSGVQTVANMLPLTHGIKLLKDCSLNLQGDSILLSVGILLTITIVGYAISFKMFRWE